MSAPKNLYLLRLKRRWKLVVILALVSTAFAVLCEQYDFLDLAEGERTSFDGGLKAFIWVNKPDSERTRVEKLFGFLKKRPSKSDKVVVVAIDDYTFNEVARVPRFLSDYGAWPYSRSVWAHTAEQLHNMGAKAVILDAVIEQGHPDPVGDLALARRVGELALPFYVGVTVSSDPKVLPLPAVTAVNHFPAKGEVPVVNNATEDDPFGEAAPAGPPGVVPLTPEEAAKRIAFPVVAMGGAEIPKLASSASDRAGGGKEFKTPVRPIDALLHTLPGFGIVEPETDEDGKLRRTSFVYTDGANTYASLSLVAVADLLKADKIELWPGKLKIGDRELQINPRGDAEINYGGTLTDRFHTPSLVNILHDFRGAAIAKEKGEEYTPKLPRELFDGKIVIIGGFAVGTGDSKPTPLEPGTPAVVKHAAELDSLMGGRYITDAPYWVSFLVTLLISLISAALIIVVRSTVAEILWPIALLFGFFLVTGAFLVYTDTHVLSAMPSLAGSVASLMATAINHFFADKRAELTREMLKRFMEKDRVDEMIEKGVLPVLEGETREITAFFSDIRGFSGFTEMWRDDPQKLVTFLNKYLSRVTKVIFDHNGAVDKYIGDAVVALFGAPFPDENHAVSGCRAALAVRAAIDEMRAEFKKEGLPDVYTRIGLNSDVMFVGNFGSEQMIDYTAMGDGMNLAARLEGANKNYGTLIMLGENTYRLAQGHVEVRELDRIRVAGKQNASSVYELICWKGQLTEKQRQVVALYHSALSQYRLGQFREALVTIDALFLVEPDDGPSKTLQKRCQKFLEQPPPMPFDGIANLEK